MRPLDRREGHHDFDSLDLPIVGDVVVIHGIDHIVESSKAHRFRTDDGMLVWEYVIHAAARLPQASEDHP